jgi:type VI protein secretion system component VasF
VNAGRIYISRDVVFDEAVFPFEKLHDNVGAYLLNLGMNMILPTWLIFLLLIVCLVIFLLFHRLHHTNGILL